MKTRIILSALLMSAIFALGGCTCANNADNPADMNDNNGTTAINEETEITDNNGEYDVSDDGMVTENAPEENKDGNDTFNDGVNENAVTDDGIVNGNELESPRVTDEVAYASSYIDSNKICWGLGKEHDELNRPLDAVKAEEKYKSLGGRFLTSGKNICLTFDEGYENGYTSEILDIIKEKNVKAVFFVTYDYCKTSAPLVQRMIDEGHIVGNASIAPITDRIKLRHRSGFGIAVLKEFWGLGIGWQLTEASISSASAMGYEMIDLSMMEGNTAAGCLYEKAGFKEYGRVEHGFKMKSGRYGTEVLMVKYLYNGMQQKRRHTPSFQPVKKTRG